MSNLFSILQQFQPIALDEMEGVRLMNRTDTKFMIGRSDLDGLLKELVSNYRVLEVEGTRSNRYQTLYYDTPDFLSYTEHHNGKRMRYKIRKREYVESHVSFLECKQKLNNGRTIKSRIKLSQIDELLDAQENGFIDERTGMHREYEPKLWNSFVRITLVDTQVGERVTIDTDIAYHVGDREVSLPELVIIEVKRDEQSGKSQVLEHLKHHLVRPESMSKYCLGVALLYPQMKTNNFKKKLLKIEKIKLAYVA